MALLTSLEGSVLSAWTLRRVSRRAWRLSLSRMRLKSILRGAVWIFGATMRCIPGYVADSCLSSAMGMVAVHRTRWVRCGLTISRIGFKSSANERSKMVSASSTMTYRTILFRSSFNCINSFSRCGVDIKISIYFDNIDFRMVASSNFGKKAHTVNLISCDNFFKIEKTCCASSDVGTTIIALGEAARWVVNIEFSWLGFFKAHSSSLFSRLINGIKYAKVFPLPVSAAMRKLWYLPGEGVESNPCVSSFVMIGMERDWMSVGVISLVRWPRVTFSMASGRPFIRASSRKVCGAHGERSCFAVWARVCWEGWENVEWRRASSFWLGFHISGMSSAFASFNVSISSSISSPVFPPVFSRNSSFWSLCVFVDSINNDSALFDLDIGLSPKPFSLAKADPCTFVILSINSR